MVGSGTTAQPTAAMGYVPALDGLRAVAVLLVMAFHAGIPGFSGARAGVDVFFVLSGFLITILLLEERSSRGAIGLKAFYMRRALRLYPALVATIVVAIGLAAIRIPIFGASSNALRNTIEGAPHSLIYTMNFARAANLTNGGYLGHTWSLAIEEQFYLVWPVVVILVMRTRTAPVTLGWIALTAAVASLSLRAGLYVAGADPWVLYHLTFTHVDGIFAGCALGVAWRVRPASVGRWGHPALVVVAAIGAAAVMIDGRHMYLYGFAVVVVATLVWIVHLMHQPSSPLTKALSTAPAVWIGRRSYGIYLYHWPIFMFIGINTTPLKLTVGFVGSFVAAWLSYIYIERPFMRRKQRWSSASTTEHHVVDLSESSSDGHR